MMFPILLRRLVCLSCFLAASAGLFAQDAPYPTAGGAGGQVITVTSLEDSGPGSLREALNTEGPRIVRFGVAGEIWLKDRLPISRPFITVEGESAPSPGITLLGDKLRIRTHDAIVRNIRVRVGALLTGSDPQSRDGIAINGAEDGSDPSYNILVENCSVSWAIDENMEVWGKNNHDIVVRNCIIAEGLASSIHPKGGTHSAGLVVSPGVNNLLIAGNLFADNAFRNPVLSVGSDTVVLNNLIYNPGFGGIHAYARSGEWAKSKLLATIVGNVVIAGPDTRSVLGFFHEKGLNAGSQIYFKDNLEIGTKAFDEGARPAGWAAGGPSPFVQAPPVPVPQGVPVLPSSEVEASVLAKAGARPDDRDEVDKRIVEEVRNRTGSIKDFPPDARLCPQPVMPDSENMALFAKLLKKYATPGGVRYAEWKASSEDMAMLQQVVDTIATSPDGDLAFYLNAYNAWMLHEALKEYPLKSVNESGLRFFDGDRIKVAGREMSFNGLEKEIFARFKDARTVFALSRASRSGVSVPLEPFSASVIKVQLDLLTGLFVNSKKGVTVTDKNVAISRVFDVEKGPFSREPKAMINTYRNKHVPDLPVVFQEYDWSLNEAK